jgi:hypothetical protein
MELFSRRRGCGILGWFRTSEDIALQAQNSLVNGKDLESLGWYRAGEDFTG